MRYQPLPSTFHAGRRKQLMSQLPPGSIVIIDTNAELVRSRDTNMPFRPDSYFYYLTGIDQSEAVLVMRGDEEWLFVKETDDFIRIWEGERYSQQEAAKVSGVATVKWTSQLKKILDSVLGEENAIYLNFSKPAAPDSLYSPGARRARALRRRGFNVESARPALAVMRMVKQPEEIRQIRRAIEITAAGFERAGQMIKAGAYEYEVEAEFAAEFIRRGANGFAYEPIVASGPEANVLHYIKNDRRMDDGELVLLDIGAEYGWYAADVTRVRPVGAKLTARQQEVYEAVLEALNIATSMMRPGADIVTIERRVCEILTEQLVQLSVLNRADVNAPGGDRLVRKYYPHAPHQLGLDTHDVGDPRLAFQPGMVHTLEPGLYLPDEGIGVRLEDDILITPDGHENLTAMIEI